MAASREITTAALSAAAKLSGERGGFALLIQQAGRVLLAEGQTREPHKIFSGTKAFWILAALRAVQEGVIRLDEKASATLPEWASDSTKAGITLAQLLNFTSGLDPQFQLHGTVANRSQVALGAPVVATPGSRFIYGPASLQVFEEVLRRKLASRGDTPIRYLERKVLAPLGLGPQRYLADAAGQPLLATGFMLTAEERLRIGQVILKRGAPIVTPRNFERCLHGSAANAAFGMALWNNRAAARGGAREADIEDMLELKWAQQNWSGICLSRHAPSDLIASVGSEYQRLYVVPSRELVVVRFGNGQRFSDAAFLELLFS